VFTLTETWLDASVSDLEIEVPDYNIYRVYRSNKNDGGICAYILNTYCTELMGAISYFNHRFSLALVENTGQEFKVDYYLHCL